MARSPACCRRRRSPRCSHPRTSPSTCPRSLLQHQKQTCDVSGKKKHESEPGKEQGGRQTQISAITYLGGGFERPQPLHHRRSRIGEEPAHHPCDGNETHPSNQTRENTPGRRLERRGQPGTRASAAHSLAGYEDAEAGAKEQRRSAATSSTPTGTPLAFPPLVAIGGGSSSSRTADR
jgi:hypothetical protein